MRATLLGFLGCVTVIAYVQRSALGVPSKQIEQDLNLGPKDLGLVWLGFYIGYAVFQLPSGWVADRWGSKAALAVFAVGWSVATGLAGLAGLTTGMFVLLGLWALMGSAQAGVFPCAAKAVAATFGKTQQAFASGVLACCMAGGAALAQKLTGVLFGPLTWPQILAVYAVPGVVWAAVFWAAVPRPDPPPSPSAAVAPVRWARLFTDRRMLLLCGQQFLRAGATVLFFTWFPRYLQETKGVTSAESGGLAAWPPVAGMLGGLVGGTVSDWLLRRTGSVRLSRPGLAVAAQLTAAGLAVAAYHTADAATAVLLMSTGLFCVYVGGVSAYATAMSMGGTRVTPVFATMNMSGNFGAAVFPFAVGAVVEATGRWDYALLLFAGMNAGSGVCWVLLNPKGTLFEEDAT